MRVSINRQTGLLIESCSCSTVETLLGNAALAGYLDADIFEVSEAEHLQLITARDAAHSMSPELTAARLERTVDMHLDAAAKLEGYDNIVNACGYAAAPNPFQVESQSFVSWRGNVWATCYQIMAEVVAETRPIPTEAELIALLPARVVP